MKDINGKKLSCRKLFICAALKNKEIKTRLRPSLWIGFFMAVPGGNHGMDGIDLPYSIKPGTVPGNFGSGLLLMLLVSTGRGKSAVDKDGRLVRPFGFIRAVV